MIGTRITSRDNLPVIRTFPYLLLFYFEVSVGTSCCPVDSNEGVGMRQGPLA
jgi:hypothetical protein